MENENLLLKSIIASIKGGMAILDVYDSDYSIEYKKDDSPLTLADKRSNQKIFNALETTGIPILSEEGREIDYRERQKWESLWVVDPLDGTKEFIKRNDEFTVNIALVENGVPVLGVIFVPVSSMLYFAEKDTGSFRMNDSGFTKELAELSDQDQKPEILSGIIERSERLPLKTRKDDSSCTIVGSRSHSTPELEEYVATKKREYRDVEFISAGSSLKFCLVAEGKADIYPRLGPTMEWDTAAGQAIAENSGCCVLQWDTGIPLGYNKENLLNPYFIVARTV
ncbi:MAG: 3'(2'),5'-bisphosphate nucleotidase CysQ [Deltaproteobacteria bacterium]|nr:3'(2'),5'-bisphosphate nucleotidase CysQ [Deltaproteobacteria bacterium]